MASDPNAVQGAAAAATELTTDDFSSLLQKEFKPRTDEAKCVARAELSGDEFRNRQRSEDQGDERWQG